MLEEDDDREDPEEEEESNMNDLEHQATTEYKDESRYTHMTTEIRHKYLRKTTAIMEFRCADAQSGRQLSENYQNDMLKTTNPKTMRRKSKTLLLPDASMEFEIEKDHDESRRIESKKTQEFSVVGNEIKNDIKKDISLMNPAFSPHASYPKPKLKADQSDFSLHVVTQQDITENQEFDDQGQTYSQTGTSFVESPARYSKAEDGRSSYRARPSSRDIFTGKMDESISQYRDTKEKELEKNKMDAHLIEQISREIKTEKANRDRINSQLAGKISRDTSQRRGRDSARTKDNHEDKPAVNHSPSIKHLNDSKAENLTINLDRSSVHVIHRTNTFSSNQQNALFDSSAAMPSPIPVKMNYNKHVTQTKKLLEAFSGSQSRGDDQSEAYRSHERPSADFGDPDTVQRLASHSQIPLTQPKINNPQTQNYHVESPPQGHRQSSVVEYVLKTHGSASYILRQRDDRPYEGLCAAGWSKFHKLAQILHSSLPDYALDMHASINVDSLIDIVDKEMTKLKAAVHSLTQQLESTRTENQRNTDKIAELEQTFKVMVDRIEKSSSNMREKAVYQNNSSYGRPVEGQTRTQAVNHVNTLQDNLRQRNNQTENFSKRNEITSNQITLDLIERAKLQVNSLVNISPRETGRFPWKIEADGHSGGLLQPNSYIDHGGSERDKASRALHLVNRYSHKGRDNTYSSFVNPHKHPNQKLIHVNTTTNIEEESHKEIRVPYDAPGLETHFTYKLDGGRYMMHRNRSVEVLQRDCSCAGHCSKDGFHANQDSVSKISTLSGIPKKPASSIARDSRALLKNDRYIDETTTGHRIPMFRSNLQKEAEKSTSLVRSFVTRERRKTPIKDSQAKDRLNEGRYSQSKTDRSAKYIPNLKYTSSGPGWHQLDILRSGKALINTE